MTFECNLFDRTFDYWNLFICRAWRKYFLLNCKSLFGNNLFLNITSVSQIFLRRINWLLNGFNKTSIPSPILTFINLIETSRLLNLIFEPGAIIMLISNINWYTATTNTVLALSHSQTWNMDARNWITIWLQITLSLTHIYWKQHLLSIWFGRCVYDFWLFLDFNSILNWK